MGKLLYSRCLVDQGQVMRVDEKWSGGDVNNKIGIFEFDNQHHQTATEQTRHMRQQEEYQRVR